MALPGSLPTIHKTSAALRQGRISCIELVETCLAEIDRREPQVHAWVLVDREGALQQARDLDLELKTGRCRGPIHGIPVGIKDIIDVAGFPTSAGYPPWANRIAQEDAAVVRQLRGHGAVILGKTVTTMFAGFDPPVTRNPWNSAHTPGGSSSGSAAATAAGMCLGAIGTQTGGSITRPASFCGVAACKPTFGRVSLEGIVPLSPTMDHAGPMASCVRDVALLLEALVTPPASASGSITPSPADAFASAIEHPPRGPMRIGRLRGLYDSAEPSMSTALDSALARWESAGATVVDLDPPPSFDSILENHKRLISGGAARAHGALYRSAPDTFLPKIASLIRDGFEVPDDELAVLAERQQFARREILAAMHGLDAIACPASRGPAPDTSTTGDPAFNAPWSFTGLPAISFPIAWDGGLPVCVQLIGRPWEEASLFRTAEWCERVVRSF